MKTNILRKAFQSTAFTGLMHLLKPEDAEQVILCGMNSYLFDKDSNIPEEEIREYIREQMRRHRWVTRDYSYPYRRIGA